MLKVKNSLSIFSAVGWWFQVIVSYHWFVIWVQDKEGGLEEKEGNAQKGTLSLNIIVSPSTYYLLYEDRVSRK